MSARSTPPLLPNVERTLQAQVEAIWMRNFASQVERLDAIRWAIAGVASGEATADQLEAAAHAAHKLAGSLGGFGLNAGSHAAARIEVLMPQVHADSVRLVQQLVSTIELELERGPRLARGSRAVRRSPRGGDDAPASGEYVDLVVIDDDPALAELISAWAADLGYATRQFVDGETALAALVETTPSVRTAAILLDVDLPGLDGFAVLSRLQHAGVTSNSAIVMLTRRSTSPDVLRALEYQIRGYVAKPVRMPELFARLRGVLEQESELFVLGAGVSRAMPTRRTA